MKKNTQQETDILWTDRTEQYSSKQECINWNK